MERADEGETGRAAVRYTVEPMTADELEQRIRDDWRRHTRRARRGVVACLLALVVYISVLLWVCL